MHDPSFMALALIVSEKKDLNAKTRKNFAKSVKLEKQVKIQYQWWVSVLPLKMYA